MLLLYRVLKGCSARIVRKLDSHESMMLSYSNTSNHPDKMQ